MSVAWKWAATLIIMKKRKAPLCRRGMAERGLEGLGEGDISSASSSKLIMPGKKSSSPKSIYH
jgi:hypothetical protein